MKLKLSAFIFILSMGISFNADSQGMAPSCPEAAKYYAKDSINIVTFGASTVEGVNGTDFQTYLARNFVNCYTNKVVRVEKFGVGGETTGQSLLRLDAAISGKTGFILILVGVNDAVRIEQGRQTIAETKDNMTQIINMCLNKKLIPIICTLQYFDDRKSKNLTRINNTISQINNIYRQLAKESNAYLADLNRFIRRDFSLYQDDVHPNARGNRLISLVVFDTINKIIAEKFLQFTVSQNYPNPVTNFTSIDIVMPEADKVTINIYNLQGKVVLSVVNEYINTGKHIVRIDLSNLPSGMYIYRVNSYSGLYTATKKLILRR